MFDDMMLEFLLIYCVSVYFGICVKILINVGIEIFNAEIKIREEISKRNAFGIILFIIKWILLSPAVPITVVLFLLVIIVKYIFTICNKISNLGMKHLDVENDEIQFKGEQK